MTQPVNLIGVGALAARLSMTRTTLLRLARKGLIPCFGTHRNRRFNYEAVLEALREQALQACCAG